MIAAIFEVEIAEWRKQNYLDIAAELKPLLEEVEGFISVERFQSLTNPNKLLSLSFFRDEEVVERWRNLPRHRAGQEKGRGGIFPDYRLRVAGLIRRVERISRDVPSRASRWATRLPTAEGVSPSARAAAEKLPRSTTFNRISRSERRFICSFRDQVNGSIAILSAFPSSAIFNQPCISERASPPCHPLLPSLHRLTCPTAPG